MDYGYGWIFNRRVSWTRLEMCVDGGGGERGVVENIKGGRKVLVRATCWATLCVFSPGLFCTVIKAAGMALLVFFKRREKGNRTDHLNPHCFTPCRGAQGMFAASLKGSCRRYFKRNVDCRETAVARLINTIGRQ